jgi:phosphopantothenoylcysteine decarboxylase/phosphopantothenate--cysteine ligase
MATLRGRGVRFVEPGEGYLACGWIGKGRLAEPDDVIEAAETILRPTGTLAGRFVIVTAGPTYEDIDAVRYIGNRSSGKMGYALAAEAARRGARVRLVSGPSSLAVPPNVESVHVRSAEEMHRAVLAQAGTADICIMAAAVADYTPRERAGGKIEKSDAPMALDLVRTRDILADLGSAPAGRPRVLIGFAAENGDPVARAREKLARKGADMIVANDISRADAGFDADTNAVTLVTAEGDEPVALASKADVARVILDRTETLLARVPAR